MDGKTTVEGTIPEVYVLWHPACRIGESLASRIYQWLRPGNGLGPDVFFRCLPRPDRSAGPLPLPIRGGEGNQPDGGPEQKTTRRSQLVTTQILILLIDCNLVADASWRYWLEGLAVALPNGPERVFLPVALDSTAFNVPTCISRLNFLRPSGLPLPVSATPADIAVVAQSLCKQLTEALCRSLVRRPEPEKPGAKEGTLAAPLSVPAASPAKITIFLSHAKQDGAKPARRIRDYIYAQTQIAAFFDENDIPYGVGFSDVLTAALKDGTAAIIVVWSAAYSSRPWCRKELSTYRTPLQDTSNPDGPEFWRLSPLLLVDALDAGADTAGMSEVGDSTHIRWSDDLKELEERIVTMALRDAMLRSFHTTLARSLPRGPHNTRIVINWLPDPLTLMSIPQLRDPRNMAKGVSEIEVYYPGKGLSALQLDTLDKHFPWAYFKSFEQALA